MKTNTFSIILITLFTINCFSQVQISIQSLQYTNNGQPTENASSCGTIDLKSSTSTSIDFGINLSKPNGQVVGSSNLYVYTKKSSSDPRIQEWYSGSIPE
ncbi:hypothetical protein [Yeosuana marina]|uniref:hypothetical protein n=1 Tax=Yeosuana marina TaxID=1565536 RepID=UPI0030C85F7D